MAVQAVVWIGIQKPKHSYHYERLAVAVILFAMLVRFRARVMLRQSEGQGTANGGTSITDLDAMILLATITRPKAKGMLKQSDCQGPTIGEASAVYLNQVQGVDARKMDSRYNKSKGII